MSITPSITLLREIYHNRHGNRRDAAAHKRRRSFWAGWVSAVARNICASVKTKVSPHISNEEIKINPNKSQGEKGSQRERHCWSAKASRIHGGQVVGHSDVRYHGRCCFYALADTGRHEKASDKESDPQHMKLLFSGSSSKKNREQNTPFSGFGRYGDYETC